MRKTLDFSPSMFDAVLADIDSKLQYVVEGHATLSAKVEGLDTRLGWVVDRVEGVDLNVDSERSHVEGFGRRVDLLAGRLDRLEAEVHGLRSERCGAHEHTAACLDRIEKHLGVVRG